MFAAMLAAYGFLMSPAPELTRPPLRGVARLLQVATVPGSAPAPLPDVPAVLRVTVTPPPPQAPFVVVCTYSGNAFPNGGWGGPWPGGGILGVRPYTGASWGQSAVDANGQFRTDFHTCLVQVDRRPILSPDARLRVNSPQPFIAGPNLGFTSSGPAATRGWSFAVSP